MGEEARIIKYKKLRLFSFIRTITGSNFLAFFLFLVDKFTLLDPDPDPGGKMNADPCGSGSWIHSPVLKEDLYMLWGCKLYS